MVSQPTIEDQLAAGMHTIVYTCYIPTYSVYTQRYHPKEFTYHMNVMHSSCMLGDTIFAIVGVVSIVSLCQKFVLHTKVYVH